jgi:hypothetical protein
MSALSWTRAKRRAQRKNFRGGYPDVVQLLANKDANVNGKARNQAELMWSVAHKHPKGVKIVLAHGADITARSAIWSKVIAFSPHDTCPTTRRFPMVEKPHLMFAARVAGLA